MFVVDPTRGRSQGFALVAAAGAFALGACSDPTQNTDLRPEGPPEVLTVLVLNDAASQVVEQATYCKVGDAKRPQRVGLPDFTARDICPADLSKGADEITNAYPDGWYVRIVFDELLNPNIEDLTEVLDADGVGTDVFTGSIANTHPVKLECESIGGGFVQVDYDGYYSPSGNNVTWPIGPSLVIKPLDPKTIATGKACKITINDNVVDKDGNKVPDADRAPGKFTFKVAPIQVISLSPADDPMGTSPIDPFVIYGNGDNVYVQFNTFVDPASFGDDGAMMDQPEWAFSPQVGECTTPRANGTHIACNPAGTASECMMVGDTCDYAGDDKFALALAGLTPAEFAFFTNAPIEGNKAYQFSIKQGAKLKDRCGVVTTFGAPSVADLTLTHYKTSAFAVKSTTPSTGDLVSAMKKPQIIFNNVVTVASLDTTEYTLMPQPAAFAQSTRTDGDVVFNGFYALDTSYTLTIKASAKVLDYYGAEFTFPEQKVITWKTQPAVTLTASPADMATVTKAAAASLTGVTFTFNAAMDPASLTATDYTFVDSTGAAVPATTSVGAAPNGCSASSSGCQLRVRGTAPLAPGNYKFTLKAGAQISTNAAITGTYTNAADKVINFKVKDPAPPAPPIQCL